MKKTLCITTLCAITALFSGCWKKKDKTDAMNPAVSTDAPIMSDEKSIKVAALPETNAEMMGGKSAEPDQNKMGNNTNDEPAMNQIRENEDNANAEEAKEGANNEEENVKEEGANNEDENAIENQKKN